MCAGGGWRGGRQQDLAGRSGAGLPTLVLETVQGAAWALDLSPDAWLLLRLAPAFPHGRADPSGARLTPVTQDGHQELWRSSLGSGPPG